MKGLNFLKEGLSPQEKTKVTKAFNKKVAEQVEIEVTTIIEAGLKDLFKGVRKEMSTKINKTVSALTESAAGEISRLDEKVGSYITHFVSELLPNELVETVQKGLRFSKHLTALEESLREDATADVDKTLRDTVVQLEAKIAEAEEKYKGLFEQMVHDAQGALNEKRKAYAATKITEYPDVVGRVIGNVLKETIGDSWSKLSESEIDDKIGRIYESVNKKKQPLNENVKPTRSGRRYAGPTPGSEEDGKGVTNPDFTADDYKHDDNVVVNEALDLLDRFSN